VNPLDPETQPPVAETPLVPSPAESDLAAETAPEGRPAHDLRWVFLGEQGLRAGWSIALFLVLSVLFIAVLGASAQAIAKNLHHQPKTGSLTPLAGLIGESILVLAILGAGALMAKLEGRRLLDYNLTGPRRLLHFASGAVAGFLALSALVGGLLWGGWMHLGPGSLTGVQIYGYAAAWGVVFLFTGFFEEGSFRCYLQFTLTRGINFWWALGLVAALCLELALRAKGNGVWGVYGIALLGLLPCLYLHLKKRARSAFWFAAWVTSTLFGFIHTSNNGENWIGIFAAALVGFVWCVSVWVTGSAWWAIGCHAAWDWAETYFYGTADSGLVATGHYLTASAAGNPFWSGGADGPEGSLLVLGVILLLLAALLVIYGRKGLRVQRDL
jgi:membrane protease YdiL (CAAX protease family)